MYFSRRIPCRTDARPLRVFAPSRLRVLSSSSFAASSFNRGGLDRSGVPMQENRPSLPASQRFVSFGTLLLLLAIVAVVTGIALWPFYNATAEGAYRSVEAIQRSVPLRLL